RHCRRKRTQRLQQRAEKAEHAAIPEQGTIRVSNTNRNSALKGASGVTAKEVLSLATGRMTQDQSWLPRPLMSRRSALYGKTSGISPARSFSCIRRQNEGVKRSACCSSKLARA